MSYDDKYPKADAHGRKNDRVTVIRCATGEEQTFIDDGFDSRDGQIFFHQQTDMLVSALAKNDNNGDPVFRVKDHKFQPCGGRAHPLASRKDIYFVPEAHGKIADAHKAKRAAEASAVADFAKVTAKPFVEAAKKVAKAAAS